MQTHTHTHHQHSHGHLLFSLRVTYLLSFFLTFFHLRNHSKNNNICLQIGSSFCVVVGCRRLFICDKNILAALRREVLLWFAFLFHWMDLVFCECGITTRFLIYLYYKQHFVRSTYHILAALRQSAHWLNICFIPMWLSLDVICELRCVRRTCI